MPANINYLPVVLFGDNYTVLQEKIPDEHVNLIYMDPPFNTGKVQARELSSENITKKYTYDDKFNNYLGFMCNRLIEAHRVLKPDGSLFLHGDYREIHYLKVVLDGIFGRDNFMNEIIWAYDYGARQKTKWPTKHDTILWYVKDKDNYTFNYDEMDRIPYMAPGLVGPEKAKKGKTPTDVWWHTIVPTNGKEKTGYPTQKPLGILERIVKVHSNKDDVLLDLFAGSGSFGVAAVKHERKAYLIDNNTDAIEVMAKRFDELFKD